MAKPTPIPNLDADFWMMFRRRYVKTESGCWIWQGSRHHARGYGILQINRRLYFAHRISYFLRFAVNPGENRVLHKCDNRLCVNPFHLFLGDSFANPYDCYKKRRHAHGERSGLAKLTNEAVRLIRQFAEVVSVEEMAATFGVKPRTIQAVIDRRSWRLIREPQALYAVPKPSAS